MTFSASVAYIRMNAIVIADTEDVSQSRRTMNTLREEQPSPNMVYLTWNETTDLFREATKETNIFQAYQAFNSRPIRQSLQIPDAIWHQLEPIMKEQQLCNSHIGFP